LLEPALLEPALLEPALLEPAAAALEPALLEPAAAALEPALPPPEPAAVPEPATPGGGPNEALSSPQPANSQQPLNVPTINAICRFIRTAPQHATEAPRHAPTANDP